MFDIWHPGLDKKAQNLDCLGLLPFFWYIYEKNVLSFIRRKYSVQDKLLNITELHKKLVFGISIQI